MTILSLANFTVDSKGTVTFSGIGSGIDFHKIADEVIKAKQAPVDRMSADITSGQKKIAELQKLQALLDSLQSSVSRLYGALSFDNAQDSFSAKAVATQSSRLDGAAPSPASSILAVTTTSLAQTGNHQLQVLQLAAAHKLGSAGFASLASDLGTASGGGSLSGSFTLNGVTIDVLPTDRLADLRDRINAANTGANPTGVTASIISISPSENLLVLSADQTGVPITLADPGGSGVLARLGFSSDGGQSFLNQLQAPQPAQFTVDGLTDPGKFQSAVQASPSNAAFGGYTTVSAGTFEVLGGNGEVLGSIAYDGSDSLDSLAAKLNDIPGIAAVVVQSRTGPQLMVSKSNGERIGFAQDTGNLLQQIGMTNQPLVLTRPSNTIDDLFSGMTINLFRAEKGTTVDIQVTRDFVAIKTSIEAFVQAYNAVRQFINTENRSDLKTGGPAADAGPLFGDSMMNGIRDQLSAIIGGGALGLSPEFSSLAQIGIGFVNNAALVDSTLADTLSINEAKLNQALINNSGDVQRLFAFNFSSADPRVTLVGFSDDSPAYSSSGYVLNLAYDASAGRLSSANLGGTPDGADDGSATVDGQSITMSGKTGASGLRLYYSGNTSLSGVQVNFTIGVGTQLYFRLKAMTDPISGLIQNAVAGLKTQGQRSQDTIDRYMRELHLTKQSLLEKFNRAETIIGRLNAIKESVLQLLGNTNDNTKH
ncbi:MAG TPA: flagellar filament capping protein FliD [Alphaproteobacteria bacterium]|nr:flagellar filament capping protein FliD [Alphaproteobacteria bacterium]